MPMTEEENERAAAELERLDTLGRALTAEEQQVAALLTVLVQQFEARPYPLCRSSPVAEGSDGESRIAAARSDFYFWFEQCGVGCGEREARDQQGACAEAGGSVWRAGGSVFIGYLW
jgi:hypothetical protein